MPILRRRPSASCPSSTARCCSSAARTACQGHTLTLWRLLQHYGVPVVLFFNKMDLPGADRAALLADARTALSDRCAALDDAESVALSSEALLEHFLNTGTLDDALTAEAVAKRELFPCLFGSARAA